MLNSTPKQWLLLLLGLTACGAPPQDNPPTQAVPSSTGQQELNAVQTLPGHGRFACVARPNVATPPARPASEVVDHFAPVCPAGQVPQSVDVHAPKGLPPLRQSSGPIQFAGTTFLYNSAYGSTNAVGMFGNLSQHAPFLASNDFHSLAELAAESSDGRQIVEIGWNVDRGVNGDANPHLFTYHWVNGATSCYNGCGFVQVSTTHHPGMLLSVSSTPVSYGIEYYQGNWWIYYAGDWVGYFPGSLWSGTYTSQGIGQWFGEVAASSASPCTDMGDGIFGTNPGAAAANGFQFLLSNGTYQTASTSPIITNASLYNEGNFSGSSMTYGGPGGC